MFVEFDIEIVHKKGKLHTLPTALSRLPQIHHIFFITVHGWIQEFQQAQENEATIWQFIDEVGSGQTAHGLDRLHDGLLWSEDKVVIPNNIQLRAKILHKVHNCHMVGHGGQKQTLRVAKKYFLWPKMEKEIIEYTPSFRVCQPMQARWGKAFGLLQQMRILSRPWDVISMDFIIDLPPSKGYNTLMVVVDFFSKQAYFILAKLPLTANDIA